MPAFPALDTLIESFRNHRPIRAGSLIMTVYGDAIAPRGGKVWLGSMIKILEPLGLNQRLIRTSVFRLTKENWLVSEQVGRRSYYSLTGPGIRRFQDAFKRVYANNTAEWDGHWLVLILNQLEQDDRQKLRQELEWHGFGTLTPTVLLHPQMQKADLQGVLQDSDYLDDLIIMENMGEGGPASRPLRLQARESWNLPKLAESYQNFLDKFRPIWSHISDKGTPTPEQCFQIRTLLIHEYRRIILRDPELPNELLPGDWAGTSARQLCSNIYQKTWKGAEEHMNEVLETAEGPLPPPNTKFYSRYGGLTK